MVEHDGLMRVFWPTDIRLSDRPGVVVGWRNSTLDVFVVTILDDVDVSIWFIPTKHHPVANRASSASQCRNPFQVRVLFSQRPSRREPHLRTLRALLDARHWHFQCSEPRAARSILGVRHRWQLP